MSVKKRTKRIMHSNVMSLMSLDVVFERIGFVIKKGLAARLLSVCLSVKYNYLLYVYITFKIIFF
jgi:hypothetical protein